MLRPRKTAGTLTVVTILLLLGIAVNISPFLRGPQEWRWAYGIPGQPIRLLIPLAVLGFYVLVVLRWIPRLSLLAPTESKSQRFLLFVVVMTPLIQFAVMTVNSPNVVQQLFYRTISAGSSGVFSVGSTIVDTRAFLVEYPNLMPGFPVHPQRYPPGLPLLFHWLEQLWANFPGTAASIGNQLRLYQCQDFNLMRLSNAAISSSLLQMSLPLVSGLIAFPLYALGSCLRNRQTGLWSAALYPLVPSFALWAGRWDQFYALVAVLAWLGVCEGLKKGRGGWIYLGGFVLGIASFFTFGVLALLAPLGIWATARSLLVADGRLRFQDWPGHLLRGAGLLAGIATPWVFYQLLLGTGFREIWRVSMSFHLGLRDYWTWLFYHIYDFGLFLGIPLFLLMCLAFWEGLQRRAEQGWLLPVAFGFGLLILDISGTSQGEVARVWLFLTPFAVLAAVHFLDSKPAWNRRYPLVLLLLAAQLLTFAAFLRVVTTGVPDPRAYAREFNLPAENSPLSTQFGDQISLLGYDLLIPTGPVADDELSLTLFWQAAAQVQRPYTVFRQLLDPAGKIVAQNDGMPQQDQWPVTCWLPGEVVADTAVLTLPENLSPGTYRLVVGMYWLETGERLAVTGADALPGDQVLVQEIVVGE